jgi:pyridoxamine 5'-phosphate oxidase
MSLRDRRVQYETAGLDVGDLLLNPMDLWSRWYEEAAAAGVAEPNAMTLSTIGVDGVPDSRVVLARGADERGFVFYTNLESAKATQLVARPGASAVFAWLDLHRQVRVRGTVQQVSAAESDGYFASRPRGSQIGAWASPQSHPLADRGELERLVHETESRFAGRDIPRPDHWGGFVLRPTAFEFWQGRPSRLHDRFRFELVNGSWVVQRLAP